jgi:hypothetical protein
MDSQNLAGILLKGCSFLDNNPAAAHDPGWMGEHGLEVSLLAIAAQVSQRPGTQMASVGQAKRFGGTPRRHSKNLIQAELPFDTG